MVSVLPSGAESYPITGDRTTRVMVKAALAYAGRGKPVFRLRPGTKEPFYGSRGFYDATDDHDQVREWWRGSPDANIGLPTGKASGFFVVDEDRAGAIAELEEKNGPLPDTLTIKTGGGGRHLYFEYPAGEKIKNSTDTLAPGIDVRGEGGTSSRPQPYGQGAV